MVYYNITFLYKIKKIYKILIYVIIALIGEQFYVVF